MDMPKSVTNASKAGICGKAVRQAGVANHAENARPPRQKMVLLRRFSYTLSMQANFELTLHGMK